MDQINSLFKKQLAVQAELEAPKGQFNSFSNFYYRSCEDILSAVKPLLKQHGLSLTLSDGIDQVGNRYYLVATATVWDIDSGESYSITGYAREEEAKKGMDSMQVTGATSSYARKYALNGLFAIDDTKDADVSDYPAQTSSKAPRTHATPQTGQSASKPVTATASPSPDPHWVTCEIPGCTKGIKPEKVEVNKKYHDGHSICYDHSTNKEVPWQSLHPAYQQGSEDKAVVDEALNTLGGEVVN